MTENREWGSWEGAESIGRTKTSGVQLFISCGSGAQASQPDSACWGRFLDWDPCPHTHLRTRWICTSGASSTSLCVYPTLKPFLLRSLQSSFV